MRQTARRVKNRGCDFRVERPVAAALPARDEGVLHVVPVDGQPAQLGYASTRGQPEAHAAASRAVDVLAASQAAQWRANGMAVESRE